MIIARGDFRVRKLPGDPPRFRVQQFVAGKWVTLLGELYHSREDALHAIDRFIERQNR